MTPEEKKLLLDIEQAILNMDIHLEGRRVFEEFANNVTKRRAIERELEIIGEATNNLLKINSQYEPDFSAQNCEPKKPGNTCLRRRR